MFDLLLNIFLRVVPIFLLFVRLYFSDNIRALPGGTVLIVYGVFLLSAAIILSVKKNKERNIKLGKERNL